DACAVRHAGMALQHALDLVRRDAIAEALDDVVLAAQEPEIAVGIPPRVIAGEEPAIVLRVRGLLRLVPVLDEEPRVVRGNADHSFAPAPDLGARLGIEELHIVARLRETGAPWTNRPFAVLRKVVAEFAHADS